MIVLTLGKKLLNQGYCFYASTWTTGTAAVHCSNSYVNSCVGTAQLSRSKMPRDLKPKIPRGTTTARFGENIMALKWHDKKEVVMLSTFHNSNR